MKKEEFLAMSLPFGLKMYKESLHSEIETPYKLTPEWLESALEFKNKPILRQLSELDQILLFEFEKCHQNIDCNNEIIELFCEEHIKTSDLITEVIIENLPFSTVFWMIKNHFDIAGLIEKGEAIDVNTLIKNPYK